MRSPFVLARLQLCRLSLCALCVICGSQLRAQEKSGGPYRISGTVVNAATGERLSRADISIATVKAPSITQSVQTSADGHFEFTDLPAAKYSLTGARRGFIPAAYDEHEQYSTAIVTGEGLRSENLVLRLAPDAVISGIVTEDSGDPVENARVSLFRQTHDTGSEKARMTDNTMTDDSGAYEFSTVAPGDYFITVSGRPWYADTGEGMPRRFNTVDAKDIPHSPLDLVYATSFYAEATNPDDATPIPLKGGERVQINFELHPLPALHLLVHSSVSDDPNLGTPMPSLSKEVFGTSDYVETNTRAIAPGLTEISVAPGEYQIHLRGGMNSPSERLSAVNVTSDQSIDAGTGQILASVSGKVAMASGEPLPRSTVVTLSSSDGKNRNGSVAGEEGTFEMANMPPGKYRPDAWGNGKHLFVSKLAVNGAQVEGSRITIGSGPVMIAATVYPDPNLDVTGFAKKAGKPAPGAMIVLVPQDPANNRDLFRRDQSDSDGSFDLLDVIPGKFTIVAIEDGWALNWAEADVIAHYLALGKSVTVTETNSKTTALKEPVEVQPK